MAYYDGNKLLNMKDLDGQKPEIYMCTSNRSAGKTTYFARYLVNKFIKNKEKFMLIYRYKYQVCDVASAFFKDVNKLFFPEYEMTEKTRRKGDYIELFLNGDPCGYAVALSSAEALKPISHLFSDVSYMLMDEFQSETNHYAPRELQNFISLHMSVARGNHQSVRYVPVYMLSNTVSILNPYYTYFGITERLREDTKFLRGNGWVLEQGYVKSVAEQQQASAFNRAFAATGMSDYVAYASQNVYLNDNKAFIGQPTGPCQYMATLKYKGQHFDVRAYLKDGIVYCGTRPDMKFPIKISVTLDDHTVNYVHINMFRDTVYNLRWYFDKGTFRFKNQLAKECIYTLLSY